MAVSTDTLLARISALEKRVTALAAQVKSDESSLSPLLTATNLSYLSGLRKLPSQSDTNSTLTGVCTWANNKQDNMDSCGF